MAAAIIFGCGRFGGSVGMAVRAVYIPPFAKARRMGTRGFASSLEVEGGTRRTASHVCLAQKWR
jgi:hypothetical protein